MRMLMKVILPNQPFNALAKKGKAGATIKRILETIKPEAVYFTEENGKRGGVLVVDVPDASKIPALSEPWFLAFEADVKFQIAMTPADLEQSALDTLGKKWG